MCLVSKSAISLHRFGRKEFVFCIVHAELHIMIPIYGTGKPFLDPLLPALLKVRTKVRVLGRTVLLS
jgi:hypothetical protein